MKVCLLWSRFGPYHVARAAAARAHLALQGDELVAIEVAGQDHYLWSKVAADERITLFPSSDYNSLSNRDIRRRLLSLLDDLRPAVVVVNGWSVAEARSALAWVAKNPNSKAVLMSESHDRNGRKNILKEWVKRRIVSRAHAGLVGGEWHRAYLSKLGIPRERTVLGYDAIDNEHFASGAALARQAAVSRRSELRLPERYFFACTRLLPRKNISGLLRGYSQYKVEMGESGWDLVIAGSGPEEERLRGLAHSLGIAGSVLWPGFLQYSELPVWYGLASAFVHPALVEPWGLVVNEAAACGLPLLVAHQVGSSSELLRDGVNGFQFDARDPSQLAALMTRLTRMPTPDLAKLGEASSTVINRFGKDRFGSGLREAVALALATH